MVQVVQELKVRDILKVGRVVVSQAVPMTLDIRKARETTVTEALVVFKIKNPLVKVHHRKETREWGIQVGEQVEEEEQDELLVASPAVFVGKVVKGIRLADLATMA